MSCGDCSTGCANCEATPEPGSTAEAPIYILVGNGQTVTCPTLDPLTGQPMDLDAVDAFMVFEDGTETALTVLHPGEGSYTALFLTNTPGRWIVRFQNTTAYPFKRQFFFSVRPLGWGY